MEHLFYVNALRSAETIYFIDCYYRYVSQSLKEKTDQMESTNKQYVQEKVSWNMFFSYFCPVPNMWLRSSIGGSTLLVLGEGGRDGLDRRQNLNFTRFLKCNDFIGSKLERIISAIFLGGGRKNKFSMKVFSDKKQMLFF